MRFGIIVFPGSNCELDCQYVLREVLRQEAELVWHGEETVAPYDCLILPGGFAHGDYLRTGAIARFSPIMPAVVRFARAGGLTIGICNGFQILCEAGLLPGALLRNRELRFICRRICVRVETAASPFTAAYRVGQVLRLPINHNEGRFYADPPTVEALERGGQILFRYCTPEGSVTDAANPNGSLGNIAGIVNAGRNVLGMMPHPERASEPILGSADGRGLFESVLTSMALR